MEIKALLFDDSPTHSAHIASVVTFPPTWPCANLLDLDLKCIGGLLYPIITSLPTKSVPNLPYLNGPLR